VLVYSRYEPWQITVLFSYVNLGVLYLSCAEFFCHFRRSSLAAGGLILITCMTQHKMRLNDTVLLLCNCESYFTHNNFVNPPNYLVSTSSLQTLHVP